MSQFEISRRPQQGKARGSADLEQDNNKKGSTQEQDVNNWETRFQELFDRAVCTYADGTRESDILFSAEDTIFLSSIGSTPQEIYDFVEDWHEDGEPTPAMIHRITAVRREYLLTVQDGIRSSQKISSASLPSPGATLGGFRWLPRIIEKARAKLRGELPSDIMYGCGMDRPFLQGVNIDLVEFLNVVWEAGDDQEKILDYVNKKTNRQ